MTFSSISQLVTVSSYETQSLVKNVQINVSRWVGILGIFVEGGKRKHLQRQCANCGVCSTVGAGTDRLLRARIRSWYFLTGLNDPSCHLHEYLRSRSEKPFCMMCKVPLELVQGAEKLYCIVPINFLKVSFLWPETLHQKEVFLFLFLIWILAL